MRSTKHLGKTQFPFASHSQIINPHSQIQMGVAQIISVKRNPLLEPINQLSVINHHFKELDFFLHRGNHWISRVPLSVAHLA